jgi:hypothetical protein
MPGRPHRPKPRDAERAPKRSPETAAPNRAHIAQHVHLLLRAEAKIEDCNFNEVHRWHQ